MTNTEIIQAIKAEIERLKGQLIRGACAAQIEMETNCKEEAYDEILSFLSTLESEKPMNQDEELEEELDRFIASGKSVTVDDYGTYKVSYHDFKKVARHFAEWQKEQDDRLADIIYQQGIEKGKDDMKEQMMKEAVELELKDNVNYPSDWNQVGMVALYFYTSPTFKFGDKVRVIVVPKED